MLKGTKFRENRQNTDMYQKTVSLNRHDCFQLSKAIVFNDTDQNHIIIKKKLKTI